MKENALFWFVCWPYIELEKRDLIGSDLELVLAILIQAGWIFCIFIFLCIVSGGFSTLQKFTNLILGGW